MTTAIPPFTHVPSECGEEQLYPFFTFNNLCNSQCFPSCNSGSNIQFVVQLSLVHFYMGTVFQNNTCHALP